MQPTSSSGCLPAIFTMAGIIAAVGLLVLSLVG